jgi:predicted phage-related endonuclease
MRRGRWLEAAALEALRETMPGWSFERANVYMRDPEVRLGATPDALATDPEHPGQIVNVQLKTVSRPTYERDWSDNDAPIGYILQTIAEGYLLGANRNLLVALVIDTYSADIAVRAIPRHPAAEQKIRSIAASFWADVAAGHPPAPDFSKDRDTIAAMFPRPEPEKVVDLSSDNRLAEILADREAVKILIKHQSAQVDEIDAEVKFKMGDAEVAELPGWRLTWKEETKEYKAREAYSSTSRVLRVKQIEEKTA